MTSYQRKLRPAWDPFAKIENETTKMNLTLQSATASMNKNPEINATFSFTTKKSEMEQKRVQWIEFPTNDNPVQTKPKSKRKILVRNSMAPLDKLAKLRKPSTHSLAKGQGEFKKVRKRRKSNPSRETLRGKKKGKDMTSDKDLKQSQPDNLSTEGNTTDEVHVSLWNRYRKEKAKDIDGLVREVINKAMNETDGMYAKRMILNAKQKDPFYMFTNPEELENAKNAMTTKKTALLRSALKRPPATDVECLVEKALEGKPPLKTILKYHAPLSADKTSTTLDENMSGFRLKKLKSTEIETLVKEAKQRQAQRKKTKALLKKLSMLGEPVDKDKPKGSTKRINAYWPRRRKRHRASMNTLVKKALSKNPAIKEKKQEKKKLTPRIRHRPDPLDQTVLRAIESSSTVTRNREKSLRKRVESKTSIKHNEPLLFVKFHQKTHLVRYRKRRKIKPPDPDPEEKGSNDDKSSTLGTLCTFGNNEQPPLEVAIPEEKVPKKDSNPFLQKMQGLKFFSPNIEPPELPITHNQEFDIRPVISNKKEEPLAKTPRKRPEKVPKKIRKRRQRKLKPKPEDVPKIESKTTIGDKDRASSTITVESKKSIKEITVPEEVVPEIPQTWYTDYLENVIAEGNCRLKKLDNAISVVQVLNTFVQFQKIAKDSDNVVAPPKTGKPNLAKRTKPPGIVAIDCIMVGKGYSGQIDMIGKVTIVNQDGEILMDKIVKPQEPITDFRSGVSGLEPIDFLHAEDFDKVRKTVVALLKGKILVGHEVSHKLEVLNIKHPYVKIRDTARYRPLAWIVSNGQTTGLNKISHAILGKQVQIGRHNSVEEARAIMNIYNCLSPGWEEYVKHSRLIKSK